MIAQPRYKANDHTDQKLGLDGFAIQHAILDNRNASGLKLAPYKLNNLEKMQTI